ncbi:MAG TPA: hypothetical protein ENH00_04150 [Actinobacteria bacterium]|nr:hypothetical protein [Actinomycetota bacterium]
MKSRYLRLRDRGGTGESPAGRWRRTLWFGAVAVLGVAVMVNVHEIGHTLAAWVLGDTTASYRLFESYPGGGYCIGCNSYDPSALTPSGVALVSLAGVAATQVIAVSVIIGRGVSKSAASRRSMSIVAGVFFFDLVWQVLQGLVADVNTQTALSRVDLADFVFIVSRETTLEPGVAVALVVAVSLVYSAILAFLISRHTIRPISRPEVAQSCSTGHR